MIKTFRKIEKVVIYMLVWIKLITTPRQFLLLSSVIVGLFSGMAVVLLKTFAYWVFVFANYLDRILELPYSNSILPIIGIMLTIFITQRFLGGHLEKGLSQIMHSVARKKSILPKRQIFAQIITNSLTVGFGGSAGVESPVAVTGATFGSTFAQHFKMNYKERTLLLACGVAAATSTAFNAPIAGVLFAIEVILVDVSITAFIPIMISAATGAIISTIFLGDGIVIQFYEKQLFEFSDIWFYIILGLITGWFSVYYSRYFQRITEHFTKLKIKNPYKKALYGASILALLIFIVPSLFGQGYESIKILSGDNPGQLLDGTIFSSVKNETWALLVFVGLASFLKVFAVGLTLNSGGNGGNFAPSIFVGSYLGFLFSNLVNLTNWFKVPVVSFTLVGMAGVFSALFHAPLTAIFLIGEITGGYSLMIPLLVVSSISFAVSKNYELYSMDVRKLAKKGDVFTSNKDRNILSSITVDEVLLTDYKTLSPDDGLDKLIEIVTNSDQRNFAVVDQNHKVVGVLDFSLVRNIVFSPFKVKHSKISEVMQDAHTLIYYENSVYIMLQKLEQSGKEHLPIIKDGKYYGFISKIKILENYRIQLKSMRVE